ncbi:MAG TPA: SpoIID/LytB domain-containing protein [Chlamydiales bacterium]|nr:SpoIID/LytB domain-containing protein [Chlamydiales bacterium]
MKSYNILLAAVFIYAGILYSDDDSFERIAAPIAPRNIQVLLEKEITEALIEVKGSYNLFNPQDGSRISSGLLGKRFIIRETENGLKWGEEFPGIHQIYIQPRGAHSSIFVNGIQYSGSMAIFGVTGMINVVNDIDIESYVQSVLATQFSTPLEPEVMASLAILIRTNAYYHALNNPLSHWHILGSFNKYSGSALIASNSPALRAANTTRHLILVHPRDDRLLPFPATWTEHCAGKTARYDTVFRVNTDVLDKGVDAPHAALTRQDTKWTYQISKKSFARMLEIAQIKSMEVFTDAPSNKAYGLRIKDAEETHDIDFLTLQNLLGATHLLSSDFTVSLKEDSVQFTGFGKGHGVGLCLYSASALAQNGENAVKILAKFFPEASLYNLNALPD